MKRQIDEAVELTHSGLISMKTIRNLITEKATRDKRLKFTSWVHHINEANLAQCYRALKRDKACGMDGVTVEAYGTNLEENLHDLVERMKTKRYRPKPVRRVYIPKPGKQDEKRGLGIPSVEDKLVQIMLKKLLEAIFEPDFENCSYGFRPNRNCTMAVKQLNGAVMTRPVNFIGEVDVRNFSTPSATIGCNVVWKNAYQTPTCCGWYANSCKQGVSKRASIRSALKAPRRAAISAPCSPISLCTMFWTSGLKGNSNPVRKDTCS